MNAATLTAALAAAQQSATLVQLVGAAVLAPRQAAAVTLAATALRLAAEAVAQQTDIDAVSWSQLDADEALILAADAKAQADALARANTEIRAGGG